MATFFQMMRIFFLYIFFTVPPDAHRCIGTTCYRLPFYRGGLSLDAAQFQFCKMTNRTLLEADFWLNILKCLQSLCSSALQALLILQNDQ